jgi:signal transduction histidine kinase
LDDGVGLPNGSAREGIGLSNTRARLEQLYGAGQRLEVRPANGQGVVTVVTLPFHTEERREDSLPDRG